jgi:choline kinase
MDRGENSVYIACTHELSNLISSHAGQEDMNRGFWLVKRLLTKDEEFKREFIEKYGQAKYDETLAHYSKTNIQQRDEEVKAKEESRRIREMRKKVKEEKRKAKEEVKIKELMEARNNMLNNIKENPYSEYRPVWERILQEREAELKALGVQLDETSPS